MRIPIPHFLLLSEAQASRDTEDDFEQDQGGRWRFVLESADGSTVLEAEDAEADEDPDRLELLSVVRGLEALDEPSHVTLVTSSRYVSHGLRFGLAEWRDSGWQWERFGERVPIKNEDLWRRVDQALQFHAVDCRMWRIDRRHGEGEVGASRMVRQRGQRSPRAVQGGPLSVATEEPISPSLRIADPSAERQAPLRGGSERRRNSRRWRRWSLWAQGCWRRWLSRPVRTAS